MSTTIPEIPVVYVDMARDRTKTVVGWPLVWRVFRRVFGLAALAAAGGSAVWIGSSPTARVVTSYTVGFWVFSLAFCILYGGAMLGDYQVKRQLAEKYGFERRFGLDTYQCRVLRIVSPPADLSERIRQALHSIAVAVRIEQDDANHIQAKLQTRTSNRLPCRVTIQIGPDEDGAKLLTVQSLLIEPLGFTDLGQNIINVEEFRLALIRLLGAQQRTMVNRLPNAP
jgi:hypothetical protein